MGEEEEDGKTIGDDPSVESRLGQQYTHYADTAKAVTGQRLRANRFYLSILSGLLVAFTFTAGKDPSTLRSASIAGIGIVGVFICSLWKQTIISHRNLNQAKYEVIEELEDDMPYSVYQMEWDRVEMEESEKGPNPGLRYVTILVSDLFSLGEGVGYREQTKVEQTVAIVIAWLFLLVSAYGLVSTAMRYLSG